MYKRNVMFLIRTVSQRNVVPAVRLHLATDASGNSKHVSLRNCVSTSRDVHPSVTLSIRPMTWLRGQL